LLRGSEDSFYMLATGGMFRKMERKLAGKISKPEAIIKSKTRLLTDDHKAIIEGLIAGRD
jgi:hypothetical protein